MNAASSAVAPPRNSHGKGCGASVMSRGVRVNARFVRWTVASTSGEARARDVYMRSVGHVDSSFTTACAFAQRWRRWPRKRVTHAMLANDIR
jgi:hypothetical protein